MRKSVQTFVVMMMLISASLATTQKTTIDDLEGTILIGQLQFNGTGNYTLELDSPQLEQPQRINLTNLLPGFKYQITFTAREYGNVSPVTGN